MPVRVSARIEKSGGFWAQFYWDAVAFAFDDVGDSRTWVVNGETQTFVLGKGWRYELQRAWDVDELVTEPDAETFGYRHLTIVLCWQSNPEGRADKTAAAGLAHATRMAPNDYPYDENPGGPGSPYQMGPALVLADAIIEGGHYDRITIISACTGATTAAEQYGTDGTDGYYRLQIDDDDVCGGVEGDNPPPILRPGDDYLLVMGGGESDSLGAPGDLSAEVQAWIDHIVENDFPSSHCVGVIVTQLPPSAPDDKTPPTSAYPDWLPVRTELDELHDPDATPPQVVVPYIDTDRRAEEKVHFSAGGHERWAPAAVVAAVDAGFFA